MSYTGCPGASPANSAQFTLKMCVAARNRKKFTKNPYFGGSRSSMMTSIKKLVTTACYDKQHVCAYLESFSRHMR